MIIMNFSNIYSYIHRDNIKVISLTSEIKLNNQ